MIQKPLKIVYLSAALSLASLFSGCAQVRTDSPVNAVSNEADALRKLLAQKEAKPKYKRDSELKGAHFPITVDLKKPKGDLLAVLTDPDVGKEVAGSRLKYFLSSEADAILKEAGGDKYADAFQTFVLKNDQMCPPEFGTQAECIEFQQKVVRAFKARRGDLYELIVRELSSDRVDAEIYDWFLMALRGEAAILNTRYFGSVVILERGDATKEKIFASILGIDEKLLPEDLVLAGEDIHWRLHVALHELEQVAGDRQREIELYPEHGVSMNMNGCSVSVTLGQLAKEADADNAAECGLSGTVDSTMFRQIAAARVLSAMFSGSEEYSGGYFTRSGLIRTTPDLREFMKAHVALKAEIMNYLGFSREEACSFSSKVRKDVVERPIGVFMTVIKNLLAEDSGDLSPEVRDLAKVFISSAELLKFKPENISDFITKFRASSLGHEGANILIFNAPANS